MKIFISYRRDDSQYQADRLCQILRTVVPDPGQNIFIDIDNIPFGVDFEEHLRTQVEACDVLLALMGRHWLDSKDPSTGQRRLESPRDFVRIEISSALDRGIRVVPVLFDGAPVPTESELPDALKPLAKRNGLHINRLSFDSDVQRLIDGLGLSDQAQDSEPTSPSVTSAGPATTSQEPDFLNEFLLPVLKCLQKDNAIWARILGLRNDENSLEFKIATQIEKDEIFPNHQIIIELVDAWRHRPVIDQDPELAGVLDAYRDHITVYKTIRNSGDYKSLPIDVGAPWPDPFYDVLVERVRRHESGSLRNADEI